MANQYWLMKSEPYVYSIDDLEKDGSTCWEGVRNYRARNNMRDMSVGDEVLYYHSNDKPPAVVGLARVCKEAYPDHYAFDKKSKYYDEKAKEDNPRWILVDFEYVGEFPKVVSLADMKADPKLEGMVVVGKGNRLSISPVEGKHFRRVCKLGGWDPKDD